AIDAGFENIDLVARDDDLDSIRDDARYRQILAKARNTDPEKAKRAAMLRRYESLRSRRSDNASAWKEVGLDLMRSGEAIAAADGSAAEFAVDSSASTLYNRACALSIAGRKGEALQSLERAILAGYGDADHMEEDDDLRGIQREPQFDRLVDLTHDLELDG